MEARSKSQPKVVAIVGQTASGKTSLAITIAEKFNGEVISADSRQVYRGLDLGTGKVTTEEMRGVPHHLIDVADPQSTTYTVHDFVRDGERAITDIHSRSKLPIIAGGTFLYVDALLGNIKTPEVPPNPELRKELEQYSTDELFSRLESLDSARAETIDRYNSRRLIRAIEVAMALGSVPPVTPCVPYNVLKLGISIEAEQLHKNIHTRLIARIDAGMIEEVQNLHTNGLSYERMEELGLEYRYISRYLRGISTREDMLAELETKIKQYAKRQMTWLKRDSNIVWIYPEDTGAIFEKVDSFLKAS